MVIRPAASGSATLRPATVSTAPAPIALLIASSSSGRSRRTGVLVTGSQRMSSNRLSMPRTIAVLQRSGHEANGRGALRGRGDGLAFRLGDPAARRGGAGGAGYSVRSRGGVRAPHAGQAV